MIATFRVLSLPIVRFNLQVRVILIVLALLHPPSEIVIMGNALLFQLPVPRSDGVRQTLGRSDGSQPGCAGGHDVVFWLLCDSAACSLWMG